MEIYYTGLLLKNKKGTNFVIQVTHRALEKTKPHFIIHIFIPYHNKLNDYVTSPYFHSVT
jgi:hypothetical protein